MAKAVKKTTVVLVTGMVLVGKLRQYAAKKRNTIGSAKTSTTDKTSIHYTISGKVIDIRIVIS